MLVGTASVAHAQSEGTFAVGLGGGHSFGVSDGTGGRAILPRVPLFRIQPPPDENGRRPDGWGPQFGLPWYTADLRQPVTQSPVDFGELHVRPIMAGYGYTKRFDRTAVTARALGGYAFNRLKRSPAFDADYTKAFGAGAITTTVSNTFVVRPDLSVWFDLGKKVGLNVSAGYTLTRPTVTISGPHGFDERHVDADVVTVTVGLVYSVF